MATNKQDKVLNIPPLRFPGFTDEWKKCIISDYGDIVTGTTPATNQEENYSNGEYLWATPSDLGSEKYIYTTQTKLSKKGFDKTRSLPPKAILVTCIGSTIGKMGMAKNKMSTNQQINSIVVNSAFDADFVYYAIQSKFPRYMSSIAIQAVPILSKSEFGKLSNVKTAIEEQIKIGNFLSKIDERITTQNKIIEDLKKLKSAIIDKVFCLPTEKQPNKRLYGFYDDWSKVKLSEICERITNKNSDLNCNLVLTIAAQYGLVNQLDFFNKSVASENLSSYYILKKGDFAYNKSYSGEYVWGAIKKLDYYEEGVLSPLYICFRPDQNKISPDFLAFYYESTKWHRGISEIAGEGARNHGLLNISVIDFFNTIHRIPSLLEQIQIATLLQTYQNKINNEERLLLHYQTQRKYLLTNIFI